MEGGGGEEGFKSVCNLMKPMPMCSLLTFSYVSLLILPKLRFKKAQVNMP